MGDGMHRPRIGGIDRDGAPAGGLGLGVLARLLQPEGVHAEEVAVVGHGLVPLAEHTRHRIAHVLVVAEIEVEVMAKPDGQDIAGMIEEDRLPALDGGSKIAPQPGRQRIDMCELARGGAGCARRRLGPGVTLFRFFLELAMAEELEEIAPQAMAHYEFGVRRQRLLEVVSRSAAEREIGADCLVKMANGVLIGRAQGQSALIGVHARSSRERRGR